MRALLITALLAGCFRGRAPERPPGTVRVDLAHLTGKSVRSSQGRLLLSCPALINATPEALGLPRTLRGYGALILTVENGPAPVGVELSVVGARGRIVDRRALGARSAAVLQAALEDLPLAAAPGALFDAQAVQISCTGQAELEVRELILLPSAGLASRPRVDAFGQRASTDWPGKVHGPAELEAAAAEETRALAVLVPPADRDQYGGWTKGTRWQESGFFTTEQDGQGRLWLVDPLGYPFWSLGATAVRTRGDATPVAGREFLFAALPDRQGAEGKETYLADGVALYRWNVLRKWGSISTWRDRTLDRLQRWGLNTVGAGSVDTEILIQRRVPHVRTLEGLAPADVPRTPSGFPDVFDPRWAAAVERVTADEEANRDNPWILGYVAADRLDWSALRLLETAPGTQLRARWSLFLRDRHGSLDALRKAWGTAAGSWDEVRDATGVPPGAAADLAELEALYAETYFGTLDAALEKHDPNHLFLGVGLAPAAASFNLGVARAIARHVDVVTVTADGEVSPAALERWHALTEKPLLVGAHQIALLGPQQVASHGPALPEGERRRHVTALLGRLAALPYAVGAHWAQYADPPLTGRAGDGANQLVGFVDITDRPHDDLVAATRDVAARLYELHATSR